MPESLTPESNTSLQQLQQRFFDYLLHGDQTFADDVRDQGGIDRDVRLQIYGNAYRLRLRETIDTDHEILGLYLGDDWFEQMVQDYIAAHPSHFASLRQFCDALPEFLRTQPPFNEHPILAEIAAFERQLLAAFDAGEAPRLSWAALQSLAPTQWPSLRLRFHPSVQLFKGQWNAVESWRALKNAQPPPPATLGETAHWLLWRNHENLTEFRSLPADELALLQGFLHGVSFDDLCTSLLQWHRADDVPNAAMMILHSWFDSELVRGIDAENTASCSPVT